MKKTVKYSILISILLSGTQAIELSFLSLSLFQISLIITCVLSLVFIIADNPKLSGKSLVFSLLWAFSSFVAFFVSTNKEWAKSYLLLGLITSVIFLIVPTVFEKRDAHLFEKVVVISQLIVIPFSIYSIIMFYSKGGMPSEISFLKIFKIVLDEETILRMRAGTELRLSLPYATPPVLSVSMAICLLFLLVNDKLFNKLVRFLLFISFAAVLMFTGSRVGIIGLGVALFFWIITIFKKGSNKTKLRIIIGGAIIFIVLFAILMNSAYFRKAVLNRFVGIDLETDRHFLVPLDGLIIWVDSFKNFIIGIGFGSSVNMMGAHTYLPPYFLNSFVTLVAERGIVGFSIVVLLFATIFQCARNVENKSQEAILLSFVCVMCCCIFYEVINNYIVLYLVSFSIMLSSERKPAKKRIELTRIRGFVK